MGPACTMWRGSNAYLLDGDVDASRERRLFLIRKLILLLSTLLGGSSVAVTLAGRLAAGAGGTGLILCVVEQSLVVQALLGHGVEVRDGEHDADSLVTELADELDLLLARLVVDLPCRLAFTISPCEFYLGEAW